MIVVIAVLVLVALAGLLIISTLRRREADAAGQLSRETRSRDKKSAQARAPARGRHAAETSSAPSQLARRGGELVPVTEPAPPVAYVPPDAEEIGVSRRQFLNRWHRRRLHPRPQRLRRRRAGLPVAATPPVASAPRSASASSPTSRRPSPPAAASPTTPRAACGSRPTRPAPSRRPAPCTATPSSPAWRPGVVALYQKCVHLGCRVPSCATSQVVRVRLPRLAVQPGR